MTEKELQAKSENELVSQCGSAPDAQVWCNTALCASATYQAEVANGCPTDLDQYKTWYISFVSTATGTSIEDLNGLTNAQLQAQCALTEDDVELAVCEHFGGSLPSEDSVQQALAAQFGVGTGQIDIQALQSACPTAPPSSSFNEYQEQSALLEKARTSDLLIDFVVMTTPQNATDEALDSAIQDTATFED